MLTPAYVSYLPWFNLYWIWALAPDIAILRQGHRTRLTRWLDVRRSLLAEVCLIGTGQGSSAKGEPKALDHVE
jgi:hypothetical protein